MQSFVKSKSRGKLLATTLEFEFGVVDLDW